MGSQFFMVFHNQYFIPAVIHVYWAKLLIICEALMFRQIFLDRADLLCFFYKFRLQRHSTESVNFTVNIMVIVRS
jgi:hypothetical protein